MSSIRIVCTRMRRQVAWLVGFMVLVGWSFVVSAQEYNAQPTRSPWAELFTIQNLILASGIIFHFGMLRQELTFIRSEIDKLKRDMPVIYARKDVLAERLDSIDKRLGTIEEKL